MNHPLLNFAFSPSAKSIADAAGISGEIGVPFSWPILVGDTISFPEAPSLAFEVTHRHLKPLEGGSTQWLLTLAHTQHPVTKPDLVARR